jgi:uracil-DNA glycosylase
MQENGISSELDAIRPSQCCSDLPDNCYRPAYAGPNYGEKTKILFVGLDPGTSETDGVRKTFTADQWQRFVFFDGYRKQKNKKNESWNGHYRGCVRIASTLLRMACEQDCRSACRLKPTSECALSYFAQTNVVKCASPKSGMSFAAERKITVCIATNLFGEIELLQPNVIVLQGRNRKSGRIYNDFERELEGAKWGSLTTDEERLVGTITWTRGRLEGRKTVLVCLAHPSARGKSNFSSAWVREILPSMPKIHSLLTAF